MKTCATCKHCIWLPERTNNGVIQTIEETKYLLKYHNDCTFSSNELYASALEHIERLETTQPKWISVEERLPEQHGQKCVGLYSQHGHDKPYPYPFVFTWYAYGDNGYVNGPHFSDEGLDGLKVHYWMPLPEPPEDEA